MYSETAIQVENLSKVYHIYERPHERLLQTITRNRKKYFREFWALNDVSFVVNRGETVGIVGRNGSGKSTLLQLICGILNPTSGSIHANGRIAALLELGSGFNPEFTGRENVYLNAAVLGLSREATDDRFDEIVKFSEISSFIDQPVKTYSSGMVVRLAFAIAINVDPEILVVDEALSVGDELFQRKCFSRIESIRASGATILFVSHSGSTIVELCDRALLIDAGELLAIGSPKKIVGDYQKLIYAPQHKQSEIRQKIRNNGHTEKVAPIEPSLDREISDQELGEGFDPSLKPTSTIDYEHHGAKISNAGIFDNDNTPVNILQQGKTYKYRYVVLFQKRAEKVRFGMLIKTTSGVELGGAVSASEHQEYISNVEAGEIYDVEFQFICSLNSGVFFLNAGVMGDVAGTEMFLHRLIDVAMFKILPDSTAKSTGIVNFSCSSRAERKTTVDYIDQ